MGFFLEILYKPNATPAEIKAEMPPSIGTQGGGQQGGSLPPPPPGGPGGPAAIKLNANKPNVNTIIILMIRVVT